MILSAHQPQFMPWLGYFDKMDQADVFVLLDDVQFKKNEWQNRNRIRGPEDWQYLTVPVRQRFPQPIHQVEIVDQLWRHKHMRTLEQIYRKAPAFSSAEELLHGVYERRWRRLAPLNTYCVKTFASLFGIRTTIRLSSEFDRLACNDPDSRLLDLCRRLGADTYLAGVGGRAYMDLARWENAGVHVVFQGFEHPTYPQIHGPFVPGLSALDLLFHCGGEGFDRVRNVRRAAA